MDNFLQKKRKICHALFSLPFRVGLIVIYAAVLAKAAINTFEYVLNSASMYLLSWSDTTVKPERLPGCAWRRRGREARDGRGAAGIGVRSLSLGQVHKHFPCRCYLLFTGRLLQVNAISQSTCMQ